LKSQFVATVSHELRTPLANIKLYLSLLRRSQVDRESHYFQTLESETERLTTMIEDLLDLSRLDAEQKIEFHAVALGELLEEIVEAQRPVCANKRLELTYDAQGKPQIMGNRDRLIQVFTNLLANAIAYTPAGDSIQVRLMPAECSEDKVGVVVEVEDSGMGIPADELPYVFDRFYHGRMAQQLKIHGSGLGLAIVREIIEGHGGSISVRSDLGRGTCIRLWLPLAEGGEMHYG
jgi:two-component system phosphate regulon sensor histidine kinase PhoR